MKNFCLTVFIIFALCLISPARAACPLDHIIICCNPDGDPNTPADNNVLYFDYTEKYKRSTLEGDWPDDYWKNWYYPMSPGWGGSCYLGEPGLDFTDDPNRTPQGSYDLKVECIALSADLTALDSNLQVLIDQPGDIFSYASSSNPVSHVHLTYRVAAGGQYQTQWFTFRIYDALNNYQMSEECTILFCQPAVPGDIYVDGVVDILDLETLSEYWLSVSNQTQLNIFAQAAIDSFNGTDINRDYHIDVIDFAQMAENWDF